MMSPRLNQVAAPLLPVLLLPIWVALRVLSVKLLLKLLLLQQALMGLPVFQVTVQWRLLLVSAPLMLMDPVRMSVRDG